MEYDVASGENKDGSPAGNLIKYLYLHLSLQLCMGLAATEGEFPDSAEISFRLRTEKFWLTRGEKQ